MSTKTIVFFGASAGVGLAALKHSLAAGHHCVALCRSPSKLTSIFTPESTPNLQVVEGNAHDAEVVAKCLQTKDGRIVDKIVTTIGGKPVLSKMSIDDPNVCAKGMAVLVEAVSKLRSQGIAGQPHIVACSSTGISKYGRDVPLAVVPLYHVMLKHPHKDKVAMENKLIESHEIFTLIRPSLLVNGETTKPVRAGIEDPKTGRESEAIGYSISREDTGKWIADNLLITEGAKYVNKMVMVTY